MRGGARRKRSVLVNRGRLRCGLGSKLLGLIALREDTESRRASGKATARANREWMTMTGGGRVRIRERGPPEELRTCPPRFNLDVDFFFFPRSWAGCPVRHVFDFGCFFRGA